MKEKIKSLQVTAHTLAKEGEYDKSIEIFDSLQEKYNVSTWDIIFYRTFYQYGRKGMEKSSFAHINKINQAVVESFAVVLAQDVDILETLVCFQDIYDHIWDLSTRLQQTIHKEHIGLIKGKSITEEFYQKQTADYVSHLKDLLALSEHFINALGNISQYTTVNLDLIWDFFQCNDGLYCFLLVYDGDSLYEKKREENLKIIQLKRPDYPGESLPTAVKPAELRHNTTEKPKKKGILGRFFS